MEKIKNWERAFAVGIIIGLIAGIMIGMVIQQTILIKGAEKIGESWEGVISEMNLEMNINETKLVEETWKMFPELNNLTVKEEIENGN